MLKFFLTYTDGDLSGLEKRIAEWQTTTGAEILEAQTVCLPDKPDMRGNREFLTTIRYRLSPPA